MTPTPRYLQINESPKISIQIKGFPMVIFHGGAMTTQTGLDWTNEQPSYKTIY